MEKSAGNKYPPVNTITDKERIGMVREIFSTITGKYDFLNHFLSLRRDIAWRRFAAKKCGLLKPTGILMLLAEQEIYPLPPSWNIHR